MIKVLLQFFVGKVNTELIKPVQLPWGHVKDNIEANVKNFSTDLCGVCGYVGVSGEVVTVVYM